MFRFLRYLSINSHGDGKSFKTPATLTLAFFILFSFSPTFVYAFESDDFRGDQRHKVISGQLPPGPEPIAGSLQHDYELSLPPGRTEFTTPTLDLHYSSQPDENISPFGYGWSIDTPYIQRINRYGTENLYSSYDFYSTLDGEIASTSQATSSPTLYGAKYDDGSFREYTHKVDNSWEVTDKNGLTYKFGTTTLSRLDNPYDSSEIYRWMIDEVRDSNGNYIKYEYYKNEGQVYPSKIIYTGNGSTDGIFDVVFEREARADIATSTLPAFEIVSKERIDRIEVQVNDVWVSRYDLGYSTGDSRWRSLLASITRSGQDESSGIVSLPTSTFSYQASTTNWTFDSSWSLPVPLSSNGTDFGSRFADVNGDGRVDIVRGYSAAGVDVNEVYINNATTTGWTKDTSWSLPAYFSNGGSDAGSRLADVNGDGFVDIVKANEQDAAKYVYINNATTSGWTLDSSWVFPEYFTNNVSDFGVRIVDVNGDGLVDVVYSTAIDPGTNKVYINHGHGWTLDANFSAPSYFSSDNGHDYGTVVVDVNGDGLNDVVEGYYHSTTTVRTFLNNGSGWTEASDDWDAPELFTSSFKDQGTRIVDVNGDGLPDIVRSQNYTSTPNKVYINTGNGWSLDEGWNLPGYMLWGLVDNGARLVDIDGNGVADFVLNGYMGGETVNKIYIANSSQTDVLTHIINDTGSETNFAYKMSGQYTNSAGNELANPDLPFNLLTLYQRGINDGFGTVGTTTYHYEGGDFYYATSTNRKFAGFNIVSEADSSSNTFKQYFHQGNATDSSNGEYSDDIAKLGRVYRTETEDSSGNTYDITVNKWDLSTIVNENKFIQLLQSLTLSYDGDGDHKDSAESFSYDSGSGNLTQHKKWGEVLGSGNGTFSDTGSDIITRNYTYATSSTISFNQPSSETQYNQSETKVSEEKYYYDSQTYGNATNGNLTKTEKWVSDTTYVDTEKTYNAYGLVVTEKDPRDKETTYTYDSFNLHIATSSNPLSQTTEFYYDYSLGEPKKIVDPNGLIFETVYDGIDRPITEKQPDLTTPSTLVTKKTYTYTDTIGSRKIVEANHLDSSTMAELYTYLDGLDRKIQTRKEAEDSNYSVKDFVYNSRGLLQKESLPYFSSGTAKTSATTNNNLYINYAYDPLERITSVINAVGTTDNSYDQWAKIVTDPLGNQKEYHYDAYGRLTSIDEHNDASEYTTSYEYNALDKLTKLTDALSNIRNFTYDGLGRRLTAEDLHDSADGTYGTWTYVYDSAGNITSRTDPKSQVITYTYDDLNRALTENYTGGAGTEIEYDYDDCTYGVGQLCIATSTGAVSSFTYNALGSKAMEIKTINSTNYTTSYSYDRQKNLLNITNPDNSEIQYTYNTAGLLESIAHKESGGSFLNLVSDFDYAPTEKVTFKSFANGTQSAYTYNANELYRLTNIVTTVPSGEGGGGGAFLGGLWNNFTKAVEELPLALKVALDLPWANAEIEDSSPAEELLVEEEPPTTTEELVEEATPIESEEKPKTEVIEEGVEPETIQEEQATTTEESVQENTAEETNTAPDTNNEDTEEPETSAEEQQVSPDVSEENSDTTESSTEEIVQEETNSDFEESLSENTPTEASEEIVEPELENHSEEVTPKEERVPDELLSNNIRALIADKEGKERATIKGKEIAKINFIDRIQRENYEIEIVSMKPIEGGVEVFARAWNQNGQIGFGRDGSVDVERFQIFNPPILVLDPSGDIYQETEKNDFETGTKVKVSRTLREDPKEALLQVIEHNLSVMKNVHGSENIVAGKVGKTTSTFYPNPSSGTAPIDGTAFRQPGGSGEAWWAIRTGSGTSVDDGSWYNAITSYNGDGGSSYSNLSRSFFGFDTTPLGIGASKTIDSATLSIRGMNKYGSGASQSTVVIDRNVPSDESQLSASDFNIANWDGVEQASNRVTYNSWNINGYNDFTLNATGTSNISTTTNTWFGTRGKGDFEDNAPVSASSVALEGYFADKDGTSYDPVLIVEHTSNNGTSTPPTDLKTENETNPPAISDSMPEFSALFNDPDTSDLAISYQIQVATTSDIGTSVYWNSTKTTLSSSTPQGMRTPEISYAGSALASSTTYYWRIKLWDYSDQEGEWSTATSTFVLSSQTAASAPTDLLTEGQTNPTDVTDTTPEFSAIYQDEDYGDIATDYQIQVSATSTFATTVWDTNKTALASSTPKGTRIADISYSGPSLVSSTLYYWRIKFWDDSNFEGAWSTTTASFSIAPPSGVEQIQHITFEYDVVGNIIKVTDISNSDAGKTVFYGYDDLYRLTSASTTVASSTPFSHIYTYDALGNILSMTGQGTYLYPETGYMNPRAVGEIGNGVASTTYAYDNNGNITGIDSDTYTHDFRNRLSGSVVNSADTLYEYDHTVQRVAKGNGTATTTYPTKYYNLTSATTTKHVFTPNGELIATLETVGATTTKHFTHPDHLGGTNVVTNDEGEVVQSLDYYPFGSDRINTGTFSEQRTFIGEEHDTESNLNYLNARYYDAGRGQFMTQDPVFINLGVDERTEQVLMDPQLHDPYGYGRNNPLKLKDPEGEFSDPFTATIIGIVLAYGIVDIAAETYVHSYALGLDGKFTRQDLRDVGASASRKLAIDYLLGDKLGFLAGLYEIGSDIAELDAGTERIFNKDNTYQLPNYYSEYQQPRIQQGNTQIYTTPSGATVDSIGNLIAGPPAK